MNQEWQPAHSGPGSVLGALHVSSHVPLKAPPRGSSMHRPISQKEKLGAREVQSLASNKWQRWALNAGGLVLLCKVGC